MAPPNNKRKKKVSGQQGVLAKKRRNTKKKERESQAPGLSKSDKQASVYNARSKFWCITINNPKDNEMNENFLVPLYKDGVLDYGVWQVEKGTTLHIQMYVILGKGHDYKFVKKLFGDKIHCEIAKGSPTQNKEYCTKEDTRVSCSLAGPWEVGICPEQTKGKRNDLLEVQLAIDDGSNQTQIARQYFNAWCKYRNSFSAYAVMTFPGRTVKTQVCLIIGEPGIGKSTIARYATRNAYHVDNALWFDGYTTGQDMIIDDMGAFLLSIKTLLSMMDNGPFNLQIKGSVVAYDVPRLFLTTNTLPVSWYPDSTSTPFSALARRFDYVFDLQNIAPANMVYCTKEWWDAQNVPDPIGWTAPVVAPIVRGEPLDQGLDEPTIPLNMEEYMGIDTSAEEILDAWDQAEAAHTIITLDSEDDAEELPDSWDNDFIEQSSESEEEPLRHRDKRAKLVGNVLEISDSDCSSSDEFEEV